MEAIVLRGHEDALTVVAVSADGRLIFTGSRDGSVRVWTLPFDQLVERAREIVGRQLTAEERLHYLPQDRRSSSDANR